MSISRPYLRAFFAGGVWFSVMAFNLVSRQPGGWSNYPARQLVILVIPYVITALLIGVAATKFPSLRSWFKIGVGTVAGSLVIMGLMALTVDLIPGGQPQLKFKSTDEMMVYFANESTRWVKKEQGVELDYSVDSIKVVEDQLARISKEVDKVHPQKGTYGVAMAYGAYIGEVIRRRDGGSWAVDDPTWGKGSYPLTTRSNSVLFPVAWCWRRLTVGEEDNVYFKALSFTGGVDVLTNVIPDK